MHAVPGRLHHVRLLADYNTWMNERLYAVCAQVPDAERKRDLGAFFRSIHGTLNHLLLGDRLWLGRFLDQPFPIESLAQELYADFATLFEERRKEDARLVEWLGGLAEADLDRVITYRSAVTGETRSYRLEDTLLHLFHHQTHHRGQLTTLLSQLGYDLGETDLAFMPGVALD